MAFDKFPVYIASTSTCRAQSEMRAIQRRSENKLKSYKQSTDGGASAKWFCGFVRSVQEKETQVKNLAEQISRVFGKDLSATHKVPNAPYSSDAWIRATRDHICVSIFTHVSTTLFHNDWHSVGLNSSNTVDLFTLLNTATHTVPQISYICKWCWFVYAIFAPHNVCRPSTVACGISIQIFLISTVSRMKQISSSRSIVRCRYKRSWVRRARISRNKIIFAEFRDLGD